jgi:hypothetical protein
VSTLATSDGLRLSPELRRYVENYPTLALAFSTVILIFVYVSYFFYLPSGQGFHVQAFYTLLDACAVALAIEFCLRAGFGNEVSRWRFLRYFPVLLSLYALFVVLRIVNLPPGSWWQTFGAIPLVGLALIGWAIKKRVDRTIKVNG